MSLSMAQKISHTHHIRCMWHIIKCDKSLVITALRIKCPFNIFEAFRHFSNYVSSSGVLLRYVQAYENSFIHKGYKRTITWSSVYGCRGPNLTRITIWWLSTFTLNTLNRVMILCDRKKNILESADKIIKKWMTGQTLKWPADSPFKIIFSCFHRDSPFLDCSLKFPLWPPALWAQWSIQIKSAEMFKFHSLSLIKCQIKNAELISRVLIRNWCCLSQTVTDFSISERASFTFSVKIRYVISAIVLLWIIPFSIPERLGCWTQWYSQKKKNTEKNLIS